MVKACRRRGAAETAARLEQGGLEVRRVKCLDECGRGPNVCLLPGKVVVNRVKDAPGRKSQAQKSGP
ncbi:(2Fe-2S) ferredoxin domain-containing protein [bacterium CPR1]|nr:(2Fe-2S) ferredoxin domain-containing protein [bacterium CPR1]